MVVGSKNPNYRSGEVVPPIPEIVEEEDERSEEDPPTEGEEDNDEVEDNSGGSSSRTLSNHEDESDSSEEIEAMQPLQMYFPPSEYRKKIKISTRCYIAGALETLLKTLKPSLTNRERSWFETHPQFKHIFHMPRDKNHKLQAMWMLLLRTACTEKEKEAWFVVNGVPIRYSIKEHALISGLDCHNYPVEFTASASQLGKMAFVEKYFKRGSKIRYQDVKAKLLEMGACRDRLNMAVLFFLSSIIKGLVKTGSEAPSVDPFLLRAVNDLEMCRTFPWGRLSYDHMLEQIAHTMNHFGGFVKENVKNPILWPISGFCIPLELLPFEAIAALRMKFREPVPGADEGCPRMCRSKFKSSEMKGYPLEQINAELGTSKDIDSLLIPSEAEKDLLCEITEEKEDDRHCVVVQSWMDRFGQGLTVFFENMLKEDVDSRSGEGPANAAADEDVNPVEPTVNARVNKDMKDLFDLLKKDMDERMTKMEDMVKGLVDKVDGLAKKISPLETYVNEQLSYMRTYEDNVFHDKSQDNVSKEGGEGVQVQEEPTNVEGSVEKEGGQSGESVQVHEEPVKEKEASTVLSEGLRDPPQDMAEDVAEGSRDPSQVMREEDPPRPRYTRTKRKSVKTVHRKRDRDRINERLEAGKRQKLEKAEKLLEEAKQPRMSTRVAEKEEKKKAEKADKERKKASEKAEKEEKK